MASVSVFMEAYDDAPPFRMLDKIICQWRRKEYNVRLQCGLDPVNSTYPGCFPLFRDRNLNEQDIDNTDYLRARPTDESDSTTAYDDISDEEHVAFNRRKPFQTVADIINFNYQTGRNSTIELEEANYDPAEDIDWAKWIAEQSEKMQQEDGLYHKLKNNDYGGNHTDEMHEKYRQLVMGDELEFHNYWPLIGVRTE